MFERGERGLFAERAAKFRGEIALGTPLESEIAGGGIVRRENHTLGDALGGVHEGVGVVGEEPILELKPTVEGDAGVGFDAEAREVATRGAGRGVYVVDTVAVAAIPMAMFASPRAEVLAGQHARFSGGVGIARGEGVVARENARGGAETHAVVGNAEGRARRRRDARRDDTEEDDHGGDDAEREDLARARHEVRLGLLARERRGMLTRRIASLLLVAVGGGATARARDERRRLGTAVECRHRSSRVRSRVGERAVSSAGARRRTVARLRGIP